jgi:hypothetical protein
LRYAQRDVCAMAKLFHVLAEVESVEVLEVVGAGITLGVTNICFSGGGCLQVKLNEVCERLQGGELVDVGNWVEIWMQRGSDDAQ